MLEARIGLEIHVELKTNTKLFCGCKNAFGGTPNSRCCPVCLALPGALPRANQHAVKLAVAAGLSLGCEIQRVSSFDRKQYFYPDLPKAYQITQFYHPICLGGKIELENGRVVRIREIHLEEDAGKMMHEGDCSLVDLNRCGVPLIEIVTEPDLRTPAEARECMTKLHELLVSIHVTEGKMQEGAMRADVNVSISDKDSCLIGERVELKNVNGFRFVEHGAAYEIKRQSAMIANGEKVRRETRRWNESQKCSELMRKKEELPDYRYFPEPDLPNLVLDDTFIMQIQENLPPRIDQIQKMLMVKYRCSSRQAEYLSVHPAFLNYFQSVYEQAPYTNIIFNWMTGFLSAQAREISSEANKPEDGLVSLFPSVQDLAYVICLSHEEKLTQENAKVVLSEIMRTKETAEGVIRRRNFQNSASDYSVKEMIDFISAFLDEHPNEVRQYKNGKAKLFSFFMAELVRKYSGVSPKQLKKILETELSMK